MLLCNSTSASICGLALSWKYRPQALGASHVSTAKAAIFKATKTIEDIAIKDITFLLILDPLDPLLDPLDPLLGPLDPLDPLLGPLLSFSLTKS
jgi:hypothetical protein